eukprot:COSAG02_NODE_8019_length_2744_cov_1.713800_1_plen_160_part_10
MVLIDTLSLHMCSQHLPFIIITDISSESIARRHLSQKVRSQPTSRIASLVDRLQESGPAEAHRNHKPKRQLNLATSHSRRRRRHSAHSTVSSIHGLWLSQCSCNSTSSRGGWSGHATVVPRLDRRRRRSTRPGMRSVQRQRRTLAASAAVRSTRTLSQHR